jgi:hypothetical protein
MPQMSREKRKKGKKKEMKFPHMDFTELWWTIPVWGRFSPFDENRRFRFSGPIFSNKFQTVQNFEKIKIQLVFSWATHKFLNRRFSKTVLTTLLSKTNLLFFN